MNKVYLVIDETEFDPEEWKSPPQSVVVSVHTTGSGAATVCDERRAARASKENERIDQHNALVGTGLLWMDVAYNHVTPETYSGGIYVEERELLT